MPRQPVRLEDIEIVFIRVRIPACEQGYGANRSEQGKHKPFCKHESDAYPYPTIYFICHDRIEQVKQHHIVKDPYGSVQEFNVDELCFHFPCYSVWQSGL